ncbi:class I SAM-dependent methyltransferase [Streptomyces sp. TRM49041]|uniref:class I SAM-dependent methyltransferase n=1 Tax=Streptomyces sp. TRM49041 TaxID=2603216 RepID=UPI0011ED519D|nr:class I SAM-dependent methyltransferase [Streptomyces sp. TRM49041]
MTTAEDLTREIQDIGYGREFGEFYDRLFPNDAYALATARELASWHPGGGLRTLELGVGTGRIAVPLSADVGDVVGVDSSPEMLERLRDRLADAPAPVTPVHGDIRTYTDTERYGLVYCVCATLSILLDPADQRAAIRRAADRLAPGGTLVVETTNKTGVLRMHEGRQRASFFTPYAEPGTGLLTCSTLSPDEPVWQASQIWFEGGTSRVGTETSRLTTPEEVDGYAADAGLKQVSLRADWLGNAYTEAAPMFIARYTRP